MLPVHDVADRPPEAQAPAARAIEADKAVQVRRTRGRVPVRGNRATARSVNHGRQQRPYTRVREDLNMCEKTKPELPGYMIAALRGRLGLESDDGSQDHCIEDMTPEDVVRECIAWDLGDRGWADAFANLVVAAGADAQKLAEGR